MMASWYAPHEMLEKNEVCCKGHEPLGVAQHIKNKKMKQREREEKEAEAK